MKALENVNMTQSISLGPFLENESVVNILYKQNIAPFISKKKPLFYMPLTLVLTELP